MFGCMLKIYYVLYFEKINQRLYFNILRQISNFLKCINKKIRVVFPLDSIINYLKSTCFYIYNL